MSLLGNVNGLIYHNNDSDISFFFFASFQYKTVSLIRICYEPLLNSEVLVYMLIHPSYICITGAVLVLFGASLVDHLKFMLNCYYTCLSQWW